ncbi:hypothetical protein K8Z61_10560 [Nocardioides sp. TRM66260-LWL]|uniref:arsenate reductase/protein-tyrosine-phosphatase family protein n=1 Tax=Nocardioides sp. TRM66260-LWL TaxID=2874478 RepID=UPI001CC62B99|nr:hypothetical protein [Nocardioides sp. TRM66260-LWL]MBZ5734938.1 hypothetical protein [Nocardioides sp. TRM66260-LWL]
MSVNGEAAAPMRLLTVCVGNICRSPLAERLLRERFAASLPPGLVTVESAGVQGLAGRSMEPHAAAELERLGGDAEGFVARRIDADIADGADLILAMTREVRSEVLTVQPRAIKRTFTIAEFAHLCRYAVEQDARIYTVAELVAFAAKHRSVAAAYDLDVPDPMGRSVEVHREVADVIAGHVHVVSALLVPLVRAQNA